MTLKDDDLQLVVWHTEGTAISGLLSWMWRLKTILPKAKIHLKLVSLEIQPFRYPQVCAPEEIYDVRIKTAQEFLVFLKKHPSAFHLINHAYEYVDLLRSLHPGLLKRLKLVGICHTDQDCYYEELVRLSGDLVGMIAVSQECSRKLEILLPDRVGKIPVFPSWDMNVPDRLEKNWSRSGPLRILFNGRLNQIQKRVFDLPEILNQLHLGEISVQLTIVGEGNDREELLRRLVGTHLTNYRYLGQKRPWEMGEILEDNDVFLQVSEFEGASVSLMEAMVAGLVPVVTSTASGAELLKHGENGLLAPIGDIRNLVNQLATLEQDRAILKKLGNGAFETARNALNELEYGKRLRDYLAALVPA